MTTLKAAWLAGFIDGEGCINMYPVNKNGHYGRISIANTHLPTLEYIQKMLGYGSITITRKGNAVNKPAYALWIENAPDIIRLLEEINPWLVTKAEQARILLDFAYTVGHGRISSEVQELRCGMYQCIKDLNRKGLKEAEYV